MSLKILLILDNIYMENKLSCFYATGLSRASKRKIHPDFDAAGKNRGINNMLGHE